NVEKMPGGRMRIIVDAPGRHKAPLSVFDMVRSGAYEMGHTASYYYKGKDPATNFFATAPFGMTPTEMNAWYYYGGGMALLNKVYSRHNIVAFPAGNTHIQMGGWFRKEISNYSVYRSNSSDCAYNSSVQGTKCEFTRVNDHFVIPKWRILEGKLNSYRN
ncbi:MAG: hypothetical protein OEX11_09320, partial [Nitrosomonas sp.]|nr:hypothetical protein [Nitrosomonas sp.]